MLRWAAYPLLDEIGSRTRPVKPNRIGRLRACQKVRSVGCLPAASRRAVLRTHARTAGDPTSLSRPLATYCLRPSFLNRSLPLA